MKFIDQQKNAPNKTTRKYEKKHIFGTFHLGIVQGNVKWHDMLRILVMCWSLFFIAFNKNQNRSSKITNSSCIITPKGEKPRRTNESSKKKLRISILMKCKNVDWGLKWSSAAINCCCSTMAATRYAETFSIFGASFQICWLLFGLYLKTTWNKFEARVPQTTHKFFVSVSF